jgi:two-component system sensor histidine kinase KdpD
VLACVVGGRWPSYAVAVVAALSYSLRLPPLDSPRVALAEDVVALGALLVVSLLVSGLVTGRIEALSRLERDRSFLLRSVSHDLRTPLGTIRAAATDLLDESAGEADPATRRHLLRLIDHDAQRLDRLVADLLSLSRIESDGMRPQRTPTDLGALAREAVEEARLTTDEVGFRLVVAPDLPEVDVDWVMLEQVVINLLDNGARHSPPGEVVDVAVRPADGGRSVVLTVADRGPGVPPDEVELIFEPFRSGRIAGSSGVGLAICRAIVAAHDGTISVHDRPGGGAEFRVVLDVG